MPPVISIVGNSNSGKTRLGASLVKALAGKGYRIAAVKHCPHGHDLDRPGSDTDVLYRAGARTVMAVSPDRVTRVDRTGNDTSLEAVVASIGGSADIVVAEGFKAGGAPKILILGDGQPPPSVENVIATVGGPIEGERASDVPEFGFEDVEELVKLLRARLFQ